MTSNNKPLWAFSEIAAALNIANPGPADGQITGVSMDSRTTQSGDLFVALSATPTGGFHSSLESTSDGHDYVADAVGRGAVAVLVSQPIDGIEVPQFQVTDTLMTGLWLLGEAGRAGVDAKVIAVTGSVGKTSTKEMLATALSAHAPKASYNNCWGVPYTLANMPSDTEWAVLEVGMNYPGEISKLASLVRPDVAVVLNVAPVHLEGVKTLEGVRLEKLALSEGLSEDGVLVVPVDLSLAGCAWSGRVVTFGAGGDAEVLAIKPVQTGMQVQVRVGEQTLNVDLQLFGEHHAYNLSAVLAAIWAAGGNLEQAASQMTDLQPIKGRGQRWQLGEVCVIDDSYNANPASMAAALQVLRDTPATRRIAVLGEMGELGEDAAQYHRQLVDELQDVDLVLCVGSLMQHLYDTLPASQRLAWVEDADTFDVARLAATLEPNDVVLFKGSRSVFWMRNIVPNFLTQLRQ